MIEKVILSAALRKIREYTGQKNPIPWHILSSAGVSKSSQDRDILTKDVEINCDKLSGVAFHFITSFSLGWSIVENLSQ